MRTIVESDVLIGFCVRVIQGVGVVRDVPGLCGGQESAKICSRIIKALVRSTMLRSCVGPSTAPVSARFFCESEDKVCGGNTKNYAAAAHEAREAQAVERRVDVGRYSHGHRTNPDYHPRSAL